MVRLQRGAVRGPEARRKLGGRVGLVVPQGGGGEVEAAHEPEEAFGRGVRFLGGGEFGADEGLKG